MNDETVFWVIWLAPTVVYLLTKGPKAWAKMSWDFVKLFTVKGNYKHPWIALTEWIHRH